MKYEVFTDGSCRGNPGPGGWCALIKNMETGVEEIIRGGAAKTTNNIMELTAICQALTEFTPDSQNPPQIKIYSDSQYCVKGIMEWLPGWVKVNFKGKKNVDLWKAYLQLSDGLDIEVEWVKAHNGHPENELVDSIAFEEASKF
jgi:ribonuclease HI